RNTRHPKKIATSKQQRKRMKDQDILSPAKWRLLSLIAEQPRTPAELAKATKTTPANVLQQITLLEAYGYIWKEAKEPNGPGKPTNTYYLKQPFLSIAFCREGLAAKKTISADETVTIIGNIFSWNQNKDWDVLIRLMWQHDDLTGPAHGVYIINTKTSGLDILVITDNVEEVRKKKSTITITDSKGNTHTISVWSHTPQEIRDGLARKEDYFINLTKKPHTLKDPANILQTIKEETHART
ncbi:ArsR family transcriptional regulator, partial [Candidatus Woesearchaeota archaeon]